jgi:phosphatidylglycerol:prolipoprotein diacylglycerol transferase
MRPILWRWGTQAFYSYSVLFCLGILLGVAYALWQGRRVLAGKTDNAGSTDSLVLDGALCALVGGLIGARAAYAIPNWADYAGRPMALLLQWGGGLVFQGGLLGGTVALMLYSLFAGVPMLRLIDLGAPALALAQSLGWTGALLHGANYGVIMRSPISLWLPDLYGVYGPRFPTQLVAALLGLGLFIGLHRLSGMRLRAGMLGWIYLFGNGLGSLLLEFTRADDAAFWGALRMTQWMEIAEVAAASVLMLWVWRGVRNRATLSACEG